MSQSVDSIEGTARVFARRLTAFSGAVPAQTKAPDRDAALEQYRARARVYDMQLAFAEPVRWRTIDRLALSAGHIVIDVGCGTGLSFSLLEKNVGRTGTIIGIEQSPEMIAQARERAQQNGWDNIVLINAPVEDAAIPEDADAVLFHFTHDILRNPAAVENAMSHLRRRARVAAAGLKWAWPWATPVNLFVWQAAMHSVTSFEGLRAPWSTLERFVPGLSIEEHGGGGVYIADGVVR